MSDADLTTPLLPHATATPLSPHLPHPLGHPVRGGGGGGGGGSGLNTNPQSTSTTTATFSPSTHMHGSAGSNPSERLTRSVSTSDAESALYSTSPTRHERDRPRRPSYFPDRSHSLAYSVSPNDHDHRHEDDNTHYYRRNRAVSGRSTAGDAEPGLPGRTSSGSFGNASNVSLSSVNNPFLTYGASPTRASVSEDPREKRTGWAGLLRRRTSAASFSSSSGSLMDSLSPVNSRSEYVSPSQSAFHRDAASSGDGRELSVSDLDSGLQSREGSRTPPDNHNAGGEATSTPPQSLPLEPGLDPDFDLSVPHLMKLFNAIDTDHDGVIPMSKLLQTLEPLAKAGAKSPRDLVLRMFHDTDHISQEAFVRAMQEIGVQLLARVNVSGGSTPGKMLDMFCYDYGPERATCRWISTDHPASVNTPQQHFADQPPINPRPGAADPEYPRDSIQQITVTLGGTGESSQADRSRPPPPPLLHVRPTGVPPSPSANSMSGLIAGFDILSQQSTNNVPRLSATSPSYPSDASTPVQPPAAPTATPAPHSHLHLLHRTPSSASVPSNLGGGSGVRFASGTDFGDRGSSSVSAPRASVGSASLHEETESRANLSEFEEGNIDLEEFIAKIVPTQPYPVRWINMVGNDASTVVRVSNYYKLHPLQIEDMLNNKERPKVELNTDGSLHVVIARLSLKSYRSTDTLQLLTDQVNICLLNNDNTVITVEKKPAASTNVLLQRISYAGSKLRLNNARFLVYAMMDGIVDDVFPILKTFHARLSSLQSLVLGRKQTSLATAKELQHVYRELNTLIFWLRPLSNVVNRLVEDLPKGPDANDLRKHMEDMKDHVQTIQEQVLSMLQWSKSLNDDYLNEQQYRMNQVMYLLTMVTTMFVPLQFITGVYGMNFKTLPELEWEYSYLVFWVAVVILLVIVTTFFRRRGWFDYTKD